MLYDNTCQPRFFSSLSGDTFVDEGRVPGTSSPDEFGSKPGCATSYSVDGFQIAYCTDQPTTTFHCSFYSSYAQCTTAVGLTPAGSFVLAGLPGSGAAPSFCWTVNIDAAGSPFVLNADSTNPRFGWSISSPHPSFLQGPVIAGRENSCQRWDGTSFDPVVNLAESGTGMGTSDLFFNEGGSTIPGCYFFGGVDPFASFWLDLYGSPCAPDGSGQAAFCVAGAISTVFCPCGNTPAPGAVGGCLNSLGIPARSSGMGTPRLASDTVVLSGTQMPALSSVLYFQGSIRHNVGNGSTFGDEIRCAGGGVTRLGTAINSPAGESQYPSGMQPSVSERGGVTQPGTRTYQAWYRNVAPFCTAAAFNTSNGWEIFWGV